MSTEFSHNWWDFINNYTEYPSTSIHGQEEPQDNPRAYGGGHPGHGVPSHRRGPLHTHSKTMGNLEMPISLEHICLDGGEETSVPRGDPKGPGDPYTVRSSKLYCTQYMQFLQGKRANH